MSPFYVPGVLPDVSTFPPNVNRFGLANIMWFAWPRIDVLRLSGFPPSLKLFGDNTSHSLPMLLRQLHFYLLHIYIFSFRRCTSDRRSKYLLGQKSLKVWVCLRSMSIASLPTSRPFPRRSTVLDWPILCRLCVATYWRSTTRWVSSMTQLLWSEHSHSPPMFHRQLHLYLLSLFFHSFCIRLFRSNYSSL